MKWANRVNDPCGQWLTGMEMNETPKLDFSKSAIARYLQLATLFRRRIDSGEWKVGEQIPTVDQLMKECGVARATVRQALGLLEADGLIVRRRAKGTFVKKAPADKLWWDVETDLKGMLKPWEPAEIEMLSVPDERMSPEIPEEIGFAAGSYKHFFRRHRRHGVPFVFTEVFFSTDLFARISPEELTKKTTLQLLRDLPGVKVWTVRQTLTIETADIHVAERLNIAINAPVAVVLRYMLDKSNKVLAISEGRYVGEMIRLAISLK